MSIGRSEDGCQIFSARIEDQTLKSLVNVMMVEKNGRFLCVKPIAVDCRFWAHPDFQISIFIILHQIFKQIETDLNRKQTWPTISPQPTDKAPPKKIRAPLCRAPPPGAQDWGGEPHELHPVVDLQRRTERSWPRRECYKNLQDQV